MQLNPRSGLQEQYLRNGTVAPVTPNHSFNRKQWGMPSFGVPFHSAPNAVMPHCSG